jgi:AraC-like DNA-binding protein
MLSFSVFCYIVSTLPVMADILGYKAIMQETQLLRHQFCERLYSIVHELAPNQPIVGEAVVIRQLANLTKLVVRSREVVRAVKLSSPLVVVVLKGTKFLHFGERKFMFESGELFVVPPHIFLDVINQPEPSSGEYISLVLELSDELLSRVRQAYPEIVNPKNSNNSDSNSDSQFHIPLSLKLMDAMVHLVKGIIEGNKDTPYLQEHHAMEVVLLLFQSELRELLLHTICPDFPTHVRYLVRSKLSSGWTAAEFAQALDMSSSTLKRKLRAHHLSFQQILDEERMHRAMELLITGENTVAQVALACGYASPSRFAVRFRKHYSQNPSAIRVKNIE